MPSDNPYADMLDTLDSLDPNLADSVREVLERANPPITTEALGLLVDDTLWGIEREESFGRAIAAGYLKLFSTAKLEMHTLYRDLVRAGGERGTTVGCLLAIHLIPVMIFGGPSMRGRFLTAVKVLESKGTYTLLYPLEALSELLESKDILGFAIERASAINTY